MSKVYPDRAASDVFMNPSTLTLKDGYNRHTYVSAALHDFLSRRWTISGMIIPITLFMSTELSASESELLSTSLESVELENSLRLCVCQNHNVSQKA